MRPNLHQLPPGFLENERQKVGLSPFQFAQFQNILRVVIEEPTHPTQKPITIVKSRNQPYFEIEPHFTTSGKYFYGSSQGLFQMFKLLVNGVFTAVIIIKVLQKAMLVFKTY